VEARTEMRIPADENFPGDAVDLLRRRSHDVAWVRRDLPGEKYSVSFVSPVSFVSFCGATLECGARGEKVRKECRKPL
jgi:hypothetical protein